MKFFVFLFALVLLNASGGKVSSIVAFKMAQRIINGYPNEAGEVPYIVTLRLKKLKESGEISYSRCGGSIIDHEWILTAGHCVNNAQSVKIGYGAIHKKEPQFTLKIDRTNIYRHNDENMDSDIALLRTPFVNFSNFVDKIDLPTEAEYRNNDFTGTWAIASGWGRTSNGGSDWLMSADVKVIDNDECSQIYQRDISFSDLCTDTKDNGKSICYGDSGGPLALSKCATEDGRPRLIGVTTFIGGKCIKGYPSGFARVTEFLDWIKKISGVGN